MDGASLPPLWQDLVAGMGVPPAAATVRGETAIVWLRQEATEFRAVGGQTAERPSLLPDLAAGRRR
jgi:hypothetical protein